MHPGSSANGKPSRCFFLGWYYWVVNKQNDVGLFCGKENLRARPQQKRFAAYMDGLAKAAGHADRGIPLRSGGSTAASPMQFNFRPNHRVLWSRYGKRWRKV
jgi:hypothetical protein